MDRLREASLNASATDRDVIRPVFFRPSEPLDRLRLEDLLKTTPHLLVHDRLHSQLRELVRVFAPSVRFTSDELDVAVADHLAGREPWSYGVWVYYPWSQRLVHLLDEQEFSRVRTDRNRNKITDAEQALLATRKVGVIGLSVGQSVCLTLALERSFGELRIADHDTLDLSNLNRLRSGVHNLGLPKTVNVAREIAEIDPFLKVTCFHEGITAGNLDAFLSDGGTLDLLVEECDAIDVKLRARQRAKAMRIPVIMDTSDRGLLDIERFDLEPERPILHGLVEHLDIEAAGRARTSEEKLPFVLPMLGLENLSPRMKASMLEIEGTITTWPQLASSVVMGGGVSGHVARRILLGEPVRSGRWWLDPDDLLAADPALGASGPVKAGGGTARNGTAIRIALADRLDGGEDGLGLGPAEITALAAAGALAPSGGNAQPWRFLDHGGRLLVFLDEERAASALDPGLRYAHLALGACIENIALEAARLGLRVDIRPYPLADEPRLVACVDLKGRTGGNLLAAELEPLAGQIPHRCTNRRASESLHLSDAEVEGLLAPLGPAANLVHLVRDRAMVDRIAELTGRAERLRFLNGTCHHDMFVKEMRWDAAEAERTRDGIDIATLELPLADRVGLRVAADPRAMQMLRDWGAGRAVERLSARSIKASGALAIVCTRDLGIGPVHEAGRTMQRFWLQASAQGILAHPVGAAIFMGLHGRFDREGILSEAEHHEAAEVLRTLKQLIGPCAGEPFFLLRLGRAAAPTARSLRLPLATLLETTNQPACA